ncbi:MAG TPA: ABC transporter ATP-binding protein [Frankiaceae bacterium]|nr:ABC transporter ATP-binding protein [Frankiaceae bacterium]
MSVLEVRGLTAAYGSNQVLHGIDLDVPSGSITAILGPSGSGKTTLLRVIAGFERARSGTVSIAEQIVESPRRHVPPERRRVGYVAQDGALFPHLSVARNVAFGLHRGSGRNPRVAELLALVGLTAFAGRYPHELSGGQQQRVALARALASSPPLVLLDEPFAALDASLRSEVRRDITRILEETGTTTVLVTHDQDEALSMAGQVAVLRAGLIAQAGVPAQIYQHPVDPELAQFLGEANLLPARVESAGLTCALGLLTAASDADHEGDSATVMIRPEQLQLQANRTADAVPATIMAVEYHGHEALLTLSVTNDSSALTLRARTPPAPGMAPGAEVFVRVAGEVHCWPARSTVAEGRVSP